MVTAGESANLSVHCIVSVAKGAVFSVVDLAAAVGGHRGRSVSTRAIVRCAQKVLLQHPCRISVAPIGYARHIPSACLGVPSDAYKRARVANG